MRIDPESLPAASALITALGRPARPQAFVPATARTIRELISAKRAALIDRREARLGRHRRLHLGKLTPINQKEKSGISRLRRGLACSARRGSSRAPTPILARARVRSGPFRRTHRSAGDGVRRDRAVPARHPSVLHEGKILPAGARWQSGNPRHKCGQMCGGLTGSATPDQTHPSPPRCGFSRIANTGGLAMEFTVKRRINGVHQLP